MSSSRPRLGPFDFRGWFAGPPAAPDAFARAVVLLERGRPGEALVALEEALREAADEPARALVHNKRGVALRALGRADAAFEAFCVALECHETSAPALVNVGNALLESGHARDAVDYYRAALRADGTYALAHSNLAAALRALGDRAGSVRALRAAERAAGRRSPGPA
jgi:tetratricopeptide (TPR) repeat protein